MEELFDFGEALKLLKRGQKVSHADWEPLLISLDPELALKPQSWGGRIQQR